jgi:Trk K+ transport system NAD-binding subunit
MDGQRIVIVGGDALALRVCAELADRAHRVTVLWDRDDDFAARVQRCGASFVRLTGDERESLHDAGVNDATVVITLSEDDHINLQFALLAREANPSIRIVLRQFNRTLGRKIEDKLRDSAVISLSSHSAATYAATAMDPDCYYGVQFPDIDGPLAGFFERTARDAGVAGCNASEAEARLGMRLVAAGGTLAFDPLEPLAADDSLVLFGLARPLVGSARSRRATGLRQRLMRSLRQLDPVSRGALVAAVIVFLVGATFFARVLRLDALTAAYFTVTTMTTTGYGDISPRDAGPAGLVGSVFLMLAGLTFSGIFIAVLSSIFTQARYDAVQGLRPITRGGHVIVCGAGNVGSRVLEFLVRLGCRVVVVERDPRPEVVEGSRDRRYELLTGDAARDATLDLCNVEGAVALVALTNSDTNNLEVALGARARNASLPIVMRVQHETFARSVRLHFDFSRTFGTAALAAPAIADLALSPGARGRVAIDAVDFALVEMRVDERLQAPPGPGAVPLALWRDGRFELMGRFADAKPHERILLLRPAAQVAAPYATEGLES